MELHASELKRIERWLGAPASWGTWVSVEKIPRPPADVHAAAGRKRLRPGWIRPMTAVGYALVMPLVLLGVAVALAFALLGALLEYVPLLVSKKLREEHRAKEEESRRKAEEKERRRAAELAAHQLDQVFDGDWNGRAGQLLLRWYARSAYPRHLLLRTESDYVIAGPRGRVGTGALKKSRVLETIPVGEMTVEKPLEESVTHRLRFPDGSWLNVDSVLDEGWLAQISF